jgi:hypothetical protein
MSKASRGRNVKEQNSEAYRQLLEKLSEESEHRERREIFRIAVSVDSD